MSDINFEIKGDLFPLYKQKLCKIRDMPDVGPLDTFNLKYNIDFNVVPNFIEQLRIVRELALDERIDAQNMIDMEQIRLTLEAGHLVNDINNILEERKEKEVWKL